VLRGGRHSRYRKEMLYDRMYDDVSCLDYVKGKGVRGFCWLAEGNQDTYGNIHIPLLRISIFSCLRSVIE
jgi:hypothetical protein